MAFDIKTSLETIQSWLASSGDFPETRIGEPKAPSSAPISAAIFMDRAAVVGSTLVDTIELHVVTVRLYTNMLEEPQEDIEIVMSQKLNRLVSNLLGDFTLGTSIRNVDAMGKHGTPLGATWGYLDLSGKMYRVVDVTVPLEVDGNSTFAS